MPVKRRRRSQDCVVAGFACVLGDLLAHSQVVVRQLAFGDAEHLAHARVGQIENPQSADARSTDAAYDFER